LFGRQDLVTVAMLSHNILEYQRNNSFQIGALSATIGEPSTPSDQPGRALVQQRALPGDRLGFRAFRPGFAGVCASGPAAPCSPRPRMENPAGASRGRSRARSCSRERRAGRERGPWCTAPAGERGVVYCAVHGSPRRLATCSPSSNSSGSAFWRSSSNDLQHDGLFICRKWSRLPSRGTRCHAMHRPTRSG
jgi:hypothetical protein